MKFIFLLLIPTLLFSQKLNETFSSFVKAIDDSTKGYWVFDNTYSGVSGVALNEDYTSLGHDLTIQGWANEAAVIASCTETSPIYSGGTALVFNGTTQYFDMASHADFNIGVGKDYSFGAWVNVTDDATAKIVISKVVADPFWMLNIDANEYTWSYLYTSGANTIVNYNTPITTGTWVHVYVTHNRDGNGLIYFNGQQVYSESISAVNGESISNSDELGIGSYGAGDNFYNGAMASVSFVKRVLTAAEVREEWALANGWNSNNGNVTRESTTTFHQGFYDGDTISYPLTNLNGSYNLSIDAKGTKSGDVLTAWLGNGTAITQTLSASSTTYQLQLIDNTSASESIYFTASASDTVYIDNVILQSSGYENRFKGFFNSGRFKR